MSVNKGLFEAVEIEINSNCNLSCSYCPNSVGERIEKGQMQPELYENILQQLQDLGFTGRIAYDFYNEPLMSRNLKNYVALTKKRLPATSIEIYTNGTLLEKSLLLELLEIGVDKLVITEHEKVKATPIRSYFSSLPAEVQSKVTLRGFSELKLTNRGGILKGIRSEVSTTLLPCQIPSMMITITVNGSLVPCFEDFYQKNQMGNVFKERIIDIWNKPEYIDFRDRLNKGLRHQFECCKDCNRLQALRGR